MSVPGVIIKRLALTQMISNFDTAGITPVLIRQIRFCGRDDVENVALLSQTSLSKTQIFKALPAADV